MVLRGLSHRSSAMDAPAIALRSLRHGSRITRPALPASQEGQTLHISLSRLLS